MLKEIEVRHKVEYASPTMTEKCSECNEHWITNNWALRSAFASVGIEHGKSVWEMAEDYFAMYHKDGHRG